jgi:probable F420-dependent oxidoreductase
MGGEARDFVVWLEQAGYGAFWTGEAWGYETFSQFGWIAGFTERIKLAVGIVNVFSRSPALIGQSAATVDEISNGRLILGLGTSGHLVIENWHGIPYERPLRRLKEYLEIIRLVTTGQRVNYEGELYKLRGFKLEFPPARPRIPLYIAAMAPASIRQAGALADGWAPMFLNPPNIPHFRSILAQGAAATGRPASEVDIAPYVWVMVTDDAPAARANAKEEIVHFVCRMGVHYARHFAVQGFADEVTEIQKRYAADRTTAAAAVAEEMVDAFAVIGNAHQCRLRLEEHFALGLERLVVTCLYRTEETVVRDTVAALAPKDWLRG